MIDKILQNYKTQVKEWQQDTRYSDEYKNEQIAAVRAQTYAQIQNHVRAQFGTPNEVGDLQGGELWGKLDRAKQALQDAQQTRPQPDHARLQNTITLVRSDMQDFTNPADLERWYNGADEYQKMALQHLRGEVRQRFHAGDGVGALLARLREDYEQAQITPEIESAAANLQAVDQEFRQTFAQAEQAAQVMGESSFLGHGSGPVLQTLSRITQDENGALKKSEDRLIQIRQAEHPYREQPTGTKLNFAP